MDPMVRKLESALSEFKIALANEDLVSAEQFLRSIQSTSDYLADDVTAIYKSQQGGDKSLGVNEQFAGGAPVMQFNSTQGVIAKGDRPMGYIGPDRIGGYFKKQGQV
tara:strand:- start:846 stop:1166 length:321 start_codon:yes stop_codon:yes gene_type:complete